ncbi:MAG: hypothetical protein AAF629_23600 [Chloroflexota bacterium]
MRNRLIILLLLTCVISLLLACSGDSEPDAISDSEPPPTATQVVVEEPDPTATPTEIPAVSAENTTSEASIKQAASDQYQHPLGIFSLTPFGTEYEEFDGLTFFYNESHLAIAFAIEDGVKISEDNLAPVVDNLLDQILLEAGMADTFTAYADEAEIINDGYLVFFEHSSADYEEGVGEIFITENGPSAGVVLLTDDYDDAADSWWATVESFVLQTQTDSAVAESTDDTNAESQTNETANTTDSVASNDSLIADSGFRPEIHGFSFYNYGNDDVSSNLTATELQRLFGDQVCASTAGGNCILTPPANQWMNQMNGYMDGGHCEGMAVLSSLLYHNQFDQISPDMFGGNQASDLNLSHEPLQREIAYWWTTQTLFPAAQNTINESPQVVLDTLIETFNQGQAASEVWAMGIYKSDFTGGHAITPYAVEDKGNGIFHVLVYDNNFPGEARAVQINTNDNTWQYQASTNPDVPEELYNGDAELQNLEIVAIYPRLQQQDCPFCQVEQQGRLSSGLAAPAPEFYEIWLEGDADLLIIDEHGKRVGYDNGQFVNEIEGADTMNVRFNGVDVWATDKEPVYRVPVGTAFEIVVDGSRLTEPGVSDISLIGPGFFVAVEELWLEPDEADSIFVETDELRHHLTYSTAYTDSPLIIFGVETDEADYAFLVQATELTGEEDTFDVAVDLDVGDFIIDTSFNTDDSVYDAFVLRIDDEGEAVFGDAGIVLEPDTTLYLNYLEWEEDGSVMFADFDYNGDGEIDESLELVDEQDYDFFAEEE